MDAQMTTGTNKIPLHPESVYIVEVLKKSGRKPYYELGIQEARKVSRAAAPFMTGEYDFSGKIENMSVPSKDVQDGIPIRVYQSAVARPDPVIMVYFHGGGQCIGSIDGHDTMCRHLADRCEGIVVNVEYRLCPEYPLPKGLEDCDNATRWVLQNKTKVGGTTNSAVGVAGDSAGGQCASLTPHYVPGLAFQILVYPHIDERCIFPSYTEFADAPILPMKLIDWFVSMHHPDPEERISNIRYSAYRQKNFSQLPPALFIVAECDPLRDDSYEYAKKLTEAGVHNELLLMEGVLHAFFHAPKIYKECCDKAYSAVASFIRRIVYKDQQES